MQPVDPVEAMLPAGQPAGQPAVEPAVEPAVLPTGQPAGQPVERRAVIQGVALAGVGIAGLSLAACGKSPATGAGSTPTPTTSNPGGPTTPASSGSGSTGVAGGAEVLANTADVPVDGGVIVGDKVVVTQPEQGTFKGFSAICTHMGCVVNDVTNGVISCPCHGSQYSVTDGSVIAGPAPAPLPPVAVKVKGNEVVRA